MTDRPDGEPRDGSQGPRDDQWTPVDGPAYQGQPGGPGQPPYQSGNPPTRSFEPLAGDPYGGQQYPDQPYPGQPYPAQPYPQQGGYPATGYEQNPHAQTQYGYQQQPYDQGGYGGGQYPPNQYPPNDGAAAEPPGGGSSRTAWLIAAVVALLVVVVLVAGYFLVRSSNNDDTAAPSSTTVQTTEDPFPSLEGPTPSLPALPGGGQTTASAAPGQIVYSLSGNGQILGLTYSADNTIKISPRLISPPWSVAIDVQGTASLTAIVLQGRIACTITLDGKVLDTSTSSTGLLRCSAPVR